jgi:RNA polymerase sigma-54 factor
MLKQTLKTNMKLDTRLEPAVILRSALLELPVLQLEERIQEELEDNPFLEGGDGLETENPDEVKKESDKGEKDFIELVRTFSDYDEDYPEQYGGDEEDEREFQQPATRSLRDSLHEQAHEVFFGQTETDIAAYIIDNLDEDGFFRVDMELVKNEFPVVSESTILRILKTIQRFEPVGIAARNPRECLIVQLLSRELYLEDTHIVLRDYYDDLVNKRYSVIMKQTGISHDQMQEVVEEIRSLNPKPGSSRINEIWESSDENTGITPDFIVKEVDGKLEVILNNSSVPNLYINKKFEQIYMSNNPEPGAKDYVRKKIESAKWFVNAVNQRRDTLKRVMQSIVNLQKDFFLFGPHRLQPMILKDVADDIEMDIATISRSTKDKYVDTEFGVYELKYFFSERSHTSDGDDVSTRIIKERIRNIITLEDKRKPLSDQTISDLLTEEGYTAARRTVQKYREQMNFPPARLRKEL